MNDLALADYAVIICFFIVLVGIGFYFRGRAKNMSQFFGGGKQVPWWLGGISFYMCSFSALGFVVYSSLAYQYGFVAVTIYWLTVPATFLGAYFFASRWRRVAKTSPLEYIELRYGNKMRQALVWLGIPARILDDGLKLFAIGSVVAAGMGFPLGPAIIISGIIMISYTFLGGLWAALVADFIQFVVLMSAVIVLPILTLSRVGGFGNFIEQAPEGFFNLLTEKYSWPMLITFFFIIFLNYSASWALVQRYYSAESDKNARKVGYLVAFLNFVGPPIFYLPAMVGRIMLPDIENMNEVYAIVCRTVLPVGMLGMVIAAMFSATMSMLAGDFNAIASVLTNDFYKRMIGRKASDKKIMVVSRLNTLIVGIAAIAMTFIIQAFQGTQDLFQVMVKIFGIFLTPIAIPMLLGMLTKKFSDFGGMLGLISGITVGVIAFAVGAIYPVLRNETVITCITSITTLAGMFIGSYLRPQLPERKQMISNFIDNVNSEKQSALHKHTESQESVSPFPIISAGVIIIGIILALTVFLTAPLTEGWISIVVGVLMIIVGLVFRYLGKKALSKDEQIFSKSEEQSV